MFSVECTRNQVGDSQSAIERRLNRVDASASYLLGCVGAGALLLAAGVALSPKPAFALPSFARQTGQPCAACHNGAFPQLTPFGRRFKLEGYSLGGTRCRDNQSAEASGAPPPSKAGATDKSAANSSGSYPQIPISVMVLPTYEHYRKDLPARPDHGRTNDNGMLQELSIFYGGQVYCQLGAFIQGTREPADRRTFLDQADIRYADKTKLGGIDLTYGVTLNNNPTVQDVWNTTPTWSYPWIGAAFGAGPPGTMIEGEFEGRVVGSGAYIFANDMLYAEISAYGTMDTDTIQAVGLERSDETLSRFDGLAPYWRVALEKNWDDYSLMVGTFGMRADIAPEGFQGDATDRKTDVGFDAQFQYTHDVHFFTGRFSYIREWQELNFTNAADPKNDLESWKASATYSYNSTYTITGAYLNVQGTDGMVPAGSLDTSGWIVDVGYLPWSNGGSSAWPWLNTRVGLTYTHFDKLEGETTDIEGNDTLLLYAWTAF
jgi:hypothetical protein